MFHGAVLAVVRCARDSRPPPASQRAPGAARADGRRPAIGCFVRTMPSRARPPRLFLRFLLLEGVALLKPWIGAVVIAAHLPKPPYVLCKELDCAHPFGALPV